APEERCLLCRSRRDRACGTRPDCAQPTPPSRVSAHHGRRGRSSSWRDEPLKPHHWRLSAGARVVNVSGRRVCSQADALVGVVLQPKRTGTTLAPFPIPLLPRLGPSDQLVALMTTM